MGTMFSPVEYARIHFVHDPHSLLQLKLTYDQALYRELETIHSRGSNAEVASAKRFLRRTQEQLNRIQRRWQQEVELLDGHHREKRQLLVAAGLVGSLFSLGLGVKNEGELRALHEATESLKENEQALLHSLGALSLRVEADYSELKASMLWAEYAARLDSLSRQAVEQLESATQRWIDGLYLLLRGQLHASVISPEDLRKGRKRLEVQCQRQGLRIAPIDNDIEILFSLPVSAVLEDGRLHVWISVPVIQVNSPVFDLLRLTHVPLPLEEYMIELISEDAYLAVDAQRQLHADVNAAELAACDQHRRFYFCSRTTFSSQRDSCAMALLQGDQAAAAKLCHKEMYRAPAVATSSSNSTSSGIRNVDVYTGQPTAIMRICPLGKGLPTINVNGHATLELPAACHLRAGGHTIFVPTKPEEVILAADGELWEAESFLEGLKAEDVLSALGSLNDTRRRIPLPHLRTVHLEQKDAFWKILMYIGFGIVFLVALDLTVRYGCLCTEHCNSRSQKGSSPIQP